MLGDATFPFRFAGGVGAMTDPEDVIYMRARYYHPGVQQFTSADLIPGNMGRPQSLGRYAYVEGMGLGGVDPSGLLLCKKGTNEFTDRSSKWRVDLESRCTSTLQSWDEISTRTVMTPTYISSRTRYHFTPDDGNMVLNAGGTIDGRLGVNPRITKDETSMSADAIVFAGAGAHEASVRFLGLKLMVKVEGGTGAGASGGAGFVHSDEEAGFFVTGAIAAKFGAASKIKISTSTDTHYYKFWEDIGSQWYDMLH